MYLAESAIRYLFILLCLLQISADQAKSRAPANKRAENELRDLLTKKEFGQVTNLIDSITGEWAPLSPRV
jgi:hypothetical protein